MQHKPFWGSRYSIGLLVIGAIALYFLLTEHRAHFFTALPFLLQWPTLLTLVMFPILLVMYWRLAITEESEMRKQFGMAYEIYAAHTPRYLPSLGRQAAIA